MVDDTSPTFLDTAIASTAVAGETESGDSAVVVCRGTTALIAVIDGLGHGPEAARAAEITASAVRDFADESLTDLMARCHETTRRSRGTALTLARLDSKNHSLTWLGVGNVDGRLLRDGSGVMPEAAVLLLGGVVGHQMPELRPRTIALSPGDVIVFATDGIRSDFADDLDISGPVQEIANTVLAAHGKQTDDALVLVARYRGEAS